jgi:short subunit dehydrogenase-like uncharacterized protein
VSDRDLSVVVFGATGVTGRQVAAYLSTRAEEVGARWAVAGRDAAKLERVLGEVGVTAPETIVADVGDPASLAAMASRTRVVLDLVGPYTLYGRPVIEACVAAGAHYADLTGEIPFARGIVEDYDERAAAAGVKVVEVSGFEALPPDLAVLLAAETARDRWGEGLATVDVDVDTPPPAGRTKLSDILSGGTLQSGAEGLADERAALSTDPAALITDSEAAEKVRRASPIALAPRFNANGDVIGPMMPGAFINPAVIHRTAALVAAAEGHDFEAFRYREGVSIPGSPAMLPLRYTAAAASAGIQTALRALARAQPPVRLRAAAAMRKLLPSSGFGPTGAALEGWQWGLAVNAETTGGHFVRVDLEADGHPGYLSTARMLGEAGLLLAEEGATPERAGCLTPATALGTGCLDRFEHARVRFSVSS